MNKKLSLVILLLILSSLLSVLLVFMAYSQSNKTSDIDRLKTGYEQLANQVNEIKESIASSDTSVEEEEVADSKEEAQEPEEPTNNKPSEEPVIEESTPQEQAPVVKTMTVTSNLNLRSAASKSGAVVTVLSPGVVVTPTGNTTTDSQGTSWTEVRDASGNQGWVATSYLK